jgi:hypothetical protein
MEPLESRAMLAATPFAPDWVVDLAPGRAPSIQITTSDSDGNLFVLDRYYGTVQPGQGERNLNFLAKYDDSGELLTTADLGDTLINANCGLATDASGAVYLASTYWGGTGGTMFNILGHPLPVPASGDWAMFVAKLDNDLESVEWVTIAMLEGAGWNNGAVSAADLAVDSDGTAVYVNGSLQGKGTIGPLKLPSKGATAGFISKLNGSTGQFEWVQLAANEQAEIAVDPSDANFIYHSTSNQIVRINPSGNTLWQRSFANASWAEMTARNGSLFLAGSFSNQTILDSVTLNSAGDSDVLVARLAAQTGNIAWAARAGGTGTDTSASIAVDGIDNLFLGGRFDGVATFGGDTLAKSSSYAYDAFFSQLDAGTGSFGQSWRFGGAGVSGVAASADSAYAVGAFIANDTDFPNGYLPMGGADEVRLYLMHFAPAPDPTTPRINGFVASPNPVEQGDPLSLSVVGMFDPSSRVSSVSFYRDVNFNRRLDVGTDVLVGVDSSSAGGWGITIATTAIGEQQFLAQATYDGSTPSLAVSAVTVVTEPIGGAVKFYVVDDAASNRTYRYAPNGSAGSTSALELGNSAPRGIASTIAGDKIWVIDTNRSVYIYSDSGALLGSWTAGSLANNALPEGIATNGIDVWIVDAKSDKVYRYAGAASRLSGSQNAASSFNLNSGNTSPKDLVTNGTSLWVVNDSTTDKVFKYTLSGALLGSWTIDSANSKPTGITINPANVSDIWIVDSGTDRVYQYNSAATRTSGNQSATTSFALAAGNTNPQGIADPPPDGNAALSVLANVPIETKTTSNRKFTPIPRSPFSAVVGTIPSNNLQILSEIIPIPTSRVEEAIEFRDSVVADNTAALDAALATLDYEIGIAI